MFFLASSILVHLQEKLVPSCSRSVSQLSSGVQPAVQRRHQLGDHQDDLQRERSGALYVSIGYLCMSCKQAVMWLHLDLSHMTSSEEVMADDSSIFSASILKISSDTSTVMESLQSALGCPSSFDFNFPWIPMTWKTENIHIQVQVSIFMSLLEFEHIQFWVSSGEQICNPHCTATVTDINCQ